MTPVGLMIVADGRAVWNHHVLIDNRLTDLDIPPDCDIFKEDGVFDQTVAVNLAARSDNGATDGASAGDASSADIRIDVLSAAVVIIKNGLGWRQVPLVGQDWPLVVVKI